MSKPPNVLACDLLALSPEGRADYAASVLPPDALQRVTAVAAEIFGVVEEARELPDGYLFRLRDTPSLLAKLAEFLEINRRCCAFLRHGLVIDPHGGPIWLQLTGEEGAKAVIAADVVRMLPAGVVPC